MTGGPARDDRTERAVRASFLGALPAEALDRLLADAVSLEVPAGGVFYRDEDPVRFGLVVVGLIRVYITSAQGRQLTIRYARPGAVLGTPLVVRGPVAVSAQAVSDSSLLMFSATVLRALAIEDAHVAWPIAEEVSHRLYDSIDAIVGVAFGTVRQRVARHLLDLACADQRGTELVAKASQQNLADSVGTVREVVGRTLHDLRAVGLIETSRSGIRVLDAERLESVAATGDM